MIALLALALVAPPTGLADLQQRAVAANIDARPIGERVVFYGMQFVGTPYVGGTLDKDLSREVCTVVLDGLDCVTLAEVSWNLARIPANELTMDRLRAGITETRYRGGKLDGYASRLHYTSEWFRDNARRGLGQSIDDLDIPGTKHSWWNINFMTANADLYPGIEKGSAVYAALREHERHHSSFPFNYIPLDGLDRAIPALQNGDLIGIVTSREGLDTSHVGIFTRDAGGHPRFLHASSTHKEVRLESDFATMIRNQPRSQGIIVFRPN